MPGGERIKLLDFGIAKLAGSSSGQHKTRTGAVMGTPTYMSPEQCRGVAVDSRADLYSLGCILFEMCAGRPPFVGEGEGDVLAAHIHMPAPALGSLARGVPKEVEALVHRLLAKAPIDRVQTAEEIVRLVDAATASMTHTSMSGPRAATAAGTSAGTRYTETTLSSAVSAGSMTSARPPRRRGVVIGTATGVLAIAGVITLAVTSGGDGSGAATTASAGSPDVRADAEAAPPPPSSEPPAPPPPGPAATAPSPAPPPPQVATASPPAEPKSAPPAPPPPAPADAPPPAVSSTVKRPVELPPPPPKPSLPATVEIAIDSVPSGAKILRDGIAFGATPYRGSVPRADREIQLVLQLRGHRDQAITVRPSAAIKQSVKLAPVPPPPPAATPKPKPTPAKPTPAKPTPTKPNDRAVNPFD